MNDLSEVVERLTKSMESLERRVAALETSGRPAPVTPLVPPAPSPSVTRPFAATEGTGIFGLLGKAMLCIAGAYLLRAAVQSDALPRWPTIVVALLYAFAWLVPAARVKASTWFASAVWAGTSALILIPMLWELTLRFRFLPGTATAAILVCFALAASALAWRSHFVTVSWIDASAAAIAALVLGIAGRDLVPFLIALLLITLASETAAARGRASGVRIVVALATDLALFALIWIYSGPAATHAEYPAIGTPTLLTFAPALLLVCATSATVQTLVRCRRISFLEIAQTLVAATLTVWTLVAFWHGPSIIPGAVCLSAAAAGYAIAFGRFDRTQAQRNYHVYATGSLALLLGGSLLSLPAGWLPLWVGVLCVLAVILGTRTARATLTAHGLALLVTTAVFSGAFASITNVMTGGTVITPGWRVWITAAFAVLCYVSLPREGMRSWWGQTLRLLFAAIAVGILTALMVWIMVRTMTLAIAPGAQHVAVLRALVSCVAALALAWGSARRRRVELAWLAWAILALTALKILFEDMRHGHLEFTAISISLFAVTLLILPRLLRRGVRVDPIN